jgi:hypothetical protein
MITCVLNGRLGNQMFQIATTIATALKHKVPYSIPQKTLNDWFPVYFTHLPFQAHSGKKYNHVEQNFCFEEIKYPGRTLELHGYFQSYKYFQDQRADIIKAFGFNWILLKDFVSIHVRRMDYLQNPDFFALGLDYYRQAIEYFRAKGHDHFFVFSDDMEWCHQNLNAREFPGCSFAYSGGETEKMDMKLMSWCEHNIIANSSFSWWGAWLNQNPDKIVVAPAPEWFKNMNKDMIPNEWIKI